MPHDQTGRQARALLAAQHCSNVAVDVCATELVQTRTAHAARVSEKPPEKPSRRVRDRRQSGVHEAQAGDCLVRWPARVAASRLLVANFVDVRRLPRSTLPSPRLPDEGRATAER